jgi:hypothetical protein
VTRIMNISFLAAISACVGCAPGPIRDLAPLVDEGRQNEVAATAKYREEEIRVRGVVGQTGLDNFSHIVVGNDGFSLAARSVQTTYPYVLLHSETSNVPSSVKCYFSESEMDTVGKLAKGSRQIITGRFQQYMRNGESVTLVLRDCSLD